MSLLKVMMMVDERGMALLIRIVMMMTDERGVTTMTHTNSSFHCGQNHRKEDRVCQEGKGI
eukprot:11350257-Ditylum_brightwellii.AAC.1